MRVITDFMFIVWTSGIATYMYLRIKFRNIDDLLTS